MNLFACLCCKPKAKAHGSVTLDPGLTPAGTTVEPGKPQTEEESRDQTTELEVIREKLKLAQRSQGKVQKTQIQDQVVGVVEIPLYESDGHSLRNAGRSYQMFVYDK